MQKLPVLLLAVTVGAMTPMQTVAALEGQIQGMIKQDVGTEVAVEQRITTELPALNVLDEKLIIQTIRPRDGMINLEVISPAEKEWQIKQVWFATFDYESGWTEAEVDERLGEWTEVETEWTKITKAQPLENMSLRAYATVAMTIGASKLHYDLTTVNLSDILYYAAEFEDLKGEEDGPIWVRGKIDYRGCVHAKSFLERETEVCVAQIDQQDGMVKYWPGGAQEDEEVMTWGEEWRLVLAGRLEEVGRELGTLEPAELSPATLEWALGQQEEKLTDIEKLLAKSTGVDAEVEEAKRLRGKIVTLRNWEAEDSSHSSDTGGSNNSDMSIGGGTETGPEDTEIKDDFGESSSKGEVAESIESVSEEMTSGAVFPALVSEASEDANIGVSVPVEDVIESEDSVAVAEVPKLGGVKAERGWLWWVVSGAAVLSLFFVAVLKRKQGRDGQR